MADISLKNLREYLISNIDQTDLIEVDKVNRYIDLTKTLRKLRADINKRGTTIEGFNGEQKYVQMNPALSKLTPISSQLLAIEKSFNFIMPNSSPSDDEPEDDDLDDGELV